ncbi:MAG: chemotaxis protein CheB [Myxococcota bacterium]
MTRVLLCADGPRLDLLVARAAVDFPNGEVITVDNGIDAVGRFHAVAPGRVVIEGRIDGRGGLRLGGALTNSRAVPLSLVVEPEEREDIEREATRRGLQTVHIATWERTAGGPVCPALLPGCKSADVDPALPSALCDPVDAIVMLGSAGTPHMLPTMLPTLSATGVPLVVAVHHNPRLSGSFSDWISDLAGVPAQPLEGFSLPLPPLTVAGATHDVEGLQPNLDTVLRRVMQLPGKLMVIVTSGMEFEGAAAVREAKERGAVLVALRPDRCPQPAMVERLIEAGLQPLLCTHAEIAQIILRATRARRVHQRRAG